MPLAAPPWLQRDWDWWNFSANQSHGPCSTSLTSKGLRLFYSISIFSRTTCSTSLTSKGLRPTQHLTTRTLTPCSTSLTSKGLRRKVLIKLLEIHTCSTSLTSKGYTFQTHKKRPVTFTGRFFVVWFQKLFLLGFTSICSWWHLFSNPIDCCNTTIHRLGNFFFGHVIACQ